MKKILTVTLLLVSLFVFAGTKIKIGATPLPHAEILELVKDDLKAQGYDLDIVVFNDYVLPNISLSDGEIDANYFQHLPYLEYFTSQRGIKNLANAGAIHVEPMGFYLKKSLDDLKKGDKIAVPNDPTNEGRALLLLHNKGIIKLKNPEELKSTIIDIVENPKGLKFIEVDAGFIPRVYQTDSSVAGGVINTNYAITIDLNPLTDAIFMEGAESPYANIITVKKDDLDSDWLKALLNALKSDKVKNFLIEKYNGAVVPTF